MHRIALAALTATSVLACGPGGDDRAPGGGDPAAMPAEARRLVETDRPWRAARVMRDYFDQVDNPDPDARILAARAEAGWGAWDRVHELLDDANGLEVDNGAGLYLLGRARDESGDVEGAIESYRSFLEHRETRPDSSTEGVSDEDVARLRLGLAYLRQDRREEGRPYLEEAGDVAGHAATWLPLLEAQALADAGDTAAVREAVAGIDDGIPGLHAWRARIEAARTVEDWAGARRLANEARAWAGTDGTRSEFFLAAGEAALEAGDSEAARDAFRAAVERDAAGPYGRAAGRHLMDGDPTPEDHLAVAQVLVEQGLQEQALDHYRAWLGSGRGSASEQQRVRYAYADALYYSNRFDEVEPALEPLGNDREAVAKIARAHAYAEDFDQAADLYLELARRDAGNGRGEQALYLAADVRHDQGDVERARALFERVLSEYPGTGRRGLVLMRLGGMAFQEEDYTEAARIWEAYRARYPRGDFSDQATYWSGRAYEEAGDSATAAERYRAVRSSDRQSYYALVAGERLGVPFWPIPMGDSPAPDPAAEARVADWMRGVDLLADAGFPDAASAEVDQLVRSAGGDRGVRYALAEALAERGYAMRAIRIALGLQGNGQPNPRLMRILYPFPYRTLITEEAKDRGFDPFVAAALIRQESLFEARITSYVGARGLMQMMPATGQEVAEREGLDRWDPELLYHPEINVHLGTALVGGYLEEYEGSLPSVFSAYNAGPHRVTWWSDFPEYGNDQLFTERIPYGETRDYVKILTRNRAIYEGLYGSAGTQPGQGTPNG